MGRPPGKVDAQLEASLRRVSGAIEHSRGQYAAMIEQIVAETSAQVADRVAAKTERITARIAEKQRRQMDKWERREERRRERQRRETEEASIPTGILFAVMAVVCLVIGLRQPAFFWMIFVALGFGITAISSFEKAARRKRMQQAGPYADAEDVRAAEASATTAAPPVSPQPAADPPDPKVARIQGLCDKLLSELESGPPIVREVVTEPRTTIEGLRKACLETARRERELRGVLSAQDESGLVTERDALAVRLTHESDAIVRDRLGQALAALEQQLAHRAELTTAASRLEAENTRILYTLENLHMQLLRARSTDIGAPELGGKLRDSLRDLGTQIDAIAEALEFASAPASAPPAAATLPPPVPVAPPVSGSDATAQADAQRAEREAAARRAAAAREAQRQ